MKKLFKFALCVVLSLSCLLCFCSCENESECSENEKSEVKQYITGRYELQSIEWSSGVIASGSTLQELEATMGDMYVELYGDGTAQLSLHGQIRDMEFTDDEMHEIDFEINTYDFSVGNGKVVLKKSGDTFTFIKG